MRNPLRELCEEVEDAIEALDGAPWATRSLADPSWRRSDNHLSAENSALDQHLLFTVAVESAPSTEYASLEDYTVLAELRVLFLFKTGAGAGPQGRIARERLAMGAALQVVQAVLGAALQVPRAIQVANAFTPGEEIGDFLPVEVAFAALVDIPYTFQ